MQTATKEEIMEMMQKPCPDCGTDMYYYECHGADKAKVVGEKICPTHNPSKLKDCCMNNPGSH